MPDARKALVIGGPLDMRMLDINDAGFFRYFCSPKPSSAQDAEPQVATMRCVAYQLVCLWGEPVWLAEGFPADSLAAAAMRRLRLAATHRGGETPLKTADGLKELFGVDGYQIIKLIDYYEQHAGAPAYGI